VVEAVAAPSAQPRPVRELVRVGDVSLSILRWSRENSVESRGDTLAKQTLRPRALLVHGLASNALLWAPAALELMRLGWECVAVDLRGHGYSDKPETGYDQRTAANDCAGLLTTIGWNEVVVMGQSWGANVAIELAANNKSLLGAVAVDGGTIELNGEFPSWEACESALAPPAFSGLAESELRDRMRTWHPSWSQLAIDGAMGCFEVLSDQMVRPWLSRDHHMAILHDLWATNVSDCYQRVMCPVLFTPADSGSVGWSANKRSSVERAMSLVQNASVSWFVGADHDLHAQKPKEFADAVDSWWDRIG
jgi:pimeloyl-ACP methyl ester carboxylesterase